MTHGYAIKRAQIAMAKPQVKRLLLEFVSRRQHTMAHEE